MISAVLCVAYPVLLFQQAGPSLVGLLIPAMLGFIFIYFFTIAPQRKQQRQLQAMRDALQVGDSVVTTGGLYGRITQMHDDKHTVQMRISGNPAVKINIARSAIAGLAPLPDEW
jgi:preprotein translocase subunit YajC